MDTYITMSQKEVKKYDIIKKAINKELNGPEAAELLNLTDRHIRRLKKKAKEQGISGLIHGSRGRPGNRTMPDAEKQKIIDLLHKHYYDYGPTLAAEELDDQHGLKRDKGTIRSIMIKEELWHPKQKKKEKHREWRQRKASYGEMIQYDGSYEHWFEDRGYDSDDFRKELRKRKIKPCLVRRSNNKKNITKQELREKKYSQQRWKAERSFNWINNNRRIDRFMEKKTSAYQEFCYLIFVKYYLKKLAK